MPNYWLMKTEPSVYSYDDLVREKKTSWTGVTNNAALKHMRSMSKGDLAFIYHSGDEKSVIGIAEIVSQPHPDPAQKDPKLITIDIKPKSKLSQPVTLTSIKADKRFAEFHLVRISRLSVMPVSKEIWDAIVKMAK